MNVISGLVSAVQNYSLHRQECCGLLIFKVQDGRDEPSGRCDNTCSTPVCIAYSMCLHTCVFAVLQTSDGEIDHFIGGGGCSRILLTSPFESKAPNTKEASCL